VNSSVQLRRARRASVGLALGSGGARGWAHVGVLQALHELGIAPAAVAGTSMGALVGGVYAAGGLEGLTALAGRIDWLDIIYHFWDPSFRLSGLIDGGKVSSLIHRFVGTRRIEELAVRFAAVAADLYTGREVRLDRGDLIEAIRASISVPALFTPVERESQLLVDGGLVNPVPCNVAADLGGRFIVAVELNLRNFDCSFSPNHSRRRRSGRRRFEPVLPAEGSPLIRRAREVLAALKQAAPDLPPRRQRRAAVTMVDVLGRALGVLESRVAAQQLRQHPPDVLVQPDLQDVRFLEHNRAPEIIQRGYRATLEAFEVCT